MTRRTLSAAFVAVVALTLVATACGNSSSGGGSGKPTLTLYSGQHEQTTNAMVAAFTKQTGIKVKVRSDDEAVLAAQIGQEGSRSPADVFYTENTPPLVSLSEKSLLSPVDAATLADVPARFDSPAKDWVGVSARVVTIVYNTDRLKAADLPRSVLDLAGSSWKGKLAISPGETDFQPIVTSIAKSEGDAATLRWLKAVKANGAAHTYPDNEALVSAVNKGQAELGVINHYYWFRLRKEVGAAATHSAIAYLAPRDVGYVLDVSGAAVLKASRHQAEAQQLVRFLVSRQGETILARSDSYEYPVGSKVAASSELRPFDQLEPNAMTVADLGDGSTALKLLQQAQLL